MQLDTSELDAVLRDISKLREAHDLLEELYLALGPYGLPDFQHAEGNIRSWRSRVQQYFHFDDSE
jgi:hypothetical protein